VIEDETYGGQSPDSIRIGTPYGTTDRIIIRTKQHNYLLFTTNKFMILKEINS
ncbi:SunI/YnzG family protein, partial [Priestia filamentosa]